MMQGSMHAANRELHNPAALARIGALEGAAVLLGPFGFGISAYEYMKRNGGGSLPRVTAIEELAQMNTPAVRKELLDAVMTKNQQCELRQRTRSGAITTPRSTMRWRCCFRMRKSQCSWLVLRLI